MELIIGYIQQGLSFIVPLIILLGLLIFVHELGHFLVAKYYGVRVEVFSLGFGKKIFSHKRGDTEYCLSLIPFGGYVKMFGDDPTAEVTGSEREFAFNHKPVGQRIAVVLAGPLMNFFFAILLFTMIAFIGEETIKPVLGDVFSSTKAYQLGFRSGDNIVSINGSEVRTWDQVQDAIEENANQTIKFEVQRITEDAKVVIEAKPDLAPNKNILSTEDFVGEIEGLSYTSSSTVVGIMGSNSAAYKAGIRTGDRIVSVGSVDVQRFKEVIAAINASTENNISLKVQPSDEKKEAYTIEISKNNSDAQELLKSFGIEKADLYVSKIMENSAASKAGLKENDRILKVNEAEITAWQEIVTVVQAYEEGSAPINLSVRRDNEIVNLEITPELTTQSLITGKEKKVYAMGVLTSMMIAPPYTFIDKTKNPVSAIKTGFVKSVYWTQATVMSFLRLIQNKVSPKSIGGPIMIGQLASKTFQIGISPFLKIMAIISINLFVLNLLPVPILDGGHLVFYTIEAIKGAPLSMRKIEVAQQVGLFILLGLMAFALVNDVTRLFQ